jgi:endonuclease/exonuclease/phosphatase (EEP) superfamily protein YafD
MKNKIAIYLVALQVLAAALLALAPHIPLLPFELLLSFTPLFTSVVVACLFASTLALAYDKQVDHKQWLLGGIIAAVTLCVFTLYTSLTIQPATPATHTSKPTLTFITFNKLYSNTDLDGIATYFRQQQPDVMTLQETTPEEVKKLQENLGYKHSFTSERLRSARGTVVGIISRHPITSTKRIELRNGPSLIRAVVSTPQNGEIAFYGVHLPGPFSPALYKQRDDSYVMMAETLQKEKLPAVLGGDFNTTIFSPALQRFTKTTQGNMQTVTTERWPQCSWYGLGAPLCARIDHVFIPKSAQLTHVTIAPYLGSDHRAVVVTFHP